MKNRINRTNRSRLGQLAILVTTAFIALAVASPAEAGHKHQHKSKHHKQTHQQHYNQKPYKHHKHFKPAHRVHHEIVYGPAGRGVVARPYVASSARFRVPRIIDMRLRGELRPYYQGRAFSPLHGHKHRVYNFPVRELGRIEYRQHYYCEDRLYMAARGGRNGSISFSLTF
jgi:hypothetical protein